MNWSIIIFCYNEKENISNVIEEVVMFLKSTLITKYEIIVVDDGSNDGSVEVIKSKINDKNNITLINHKNNKGIGAALRSGYNASKYEYVCAVPGDNQFDIKELLKVQPFKENEFVSFYRENMYKSWYRKLIHQLNKVFNRFFLNLKMRDVNWVKVYKKKQLESVNYELKSSILESEICAKLFKMNCKVIEYPSAYLPRSYGSPKGGTWKTVTMAAKETWSLYKKVKAFKPS